MGITVLPTENDGKNDSRDTCRLTPKQSAKAVLDLLREENRPYTANDVAADVKGVSKAAAQQHLRDMHEQKAIQCKVFGKQTLYHAIQTPLEDDHQEKLEAMEAKTARIQEEATALESEESELRTVLTKSNILEPLSELEASVRRLGKEKEALSARLARLRSGNLKSINTDEKNKITKQYRKAKDAAEARKKIRAEVFKLFESKLGNDKAAMVKKSMGLDL